MKKLLSVSLALILCVCLCSTAYAATVPTFTQDWTKTGNSFVSINENVPMSVAEDQNNPASGVVPTLSRAGDGTVTINLPEYSQPGVYKYSITQTAGNSQGATYDTGTIGFEVLVSYNNSGSVYVEKTGLSKVDGAKKDSFTNIFAFGNLVITNQVTGNLGDTNATFPITITFTAEKVVKTSITYRVNDGSDKTIAPGANGWSEKTITVTGVANNGTLHFYDLPEGITYSISTEGTDGYTVTASPSTGTIAAAQDSNVTVTQNKEADINTGVSLDSLPYVVLLSVVLLGFALLLIRKRLREEA